MSEQKRERKLGEIFKRMIPLGILKEFFDEASDITVRLDRERRMMEVHCHLPKLYRKKDIYELEAAIAQTYELAQIRIFTHYEENLFSDAYMPEIFAEAARVGVVINGFFNRYTLRWEEDPKKLFIEIPFTHGGISLLDLARTGEVIAGILHSEFGMACPVTVCQSADAQSEYQSYMQGQLESLRSQSALIVEEARRLEEEAAKRQEMGDKAASAEEKPTLPRVASLFPGSDTVETVEEGVLRAGTYTFDVREPNVVFGEAFSCENAIPLRAITGTMRNAVILCEVFDVQNKDTRKGDKTVITVSVTDREASLYIKVTVPIEQTEETMSLWSKGKRYAVRGTIKKDNFDGELYMQYTDIAQVKPVLRMDNAPE